MGLGDSLIATGMAKGAKARGKRIAFGDGNKISWDHNDNIVFRNNPNIATPGSECSNDIEWMSYHRGSRIYNYHDRTNNKWVWNYKFKIKPGEMFFNDEELSFAEKVGKGFILVEPYVPAQKVSAPNKTWPLNRYEDVVTLLNEKGYDVRHFSYDNRKFNGASAIKTPTYRHALAVLAQAALYIGPEGGLHHGAAAVEIPAVVIFGGWVPPKVTGYDGHINLTGGAENFCGLLAPCDHCKQAMERISVEEVFNSAMSLI